MQRLFELLRTHNELYEVLKTKEIVEQSKIVHLDEAFFVLCWGVVEYYIDQSCRNLIKMKKLSPDWDERRAFEIHNPEDDKMGGLSFENKTKLLINKQTQREVYGLLLQLYKQRNRLAHGRELPQTIDLKGYYTLAELLESAITL